MVEFVQQESAKATAMPDVSHDVLELQLRTLNQNITHVMDAVDEMRDELKKISVLEVNHTHQSEALGRAFSDIKAVKEAHEARVIKDNEAHARYDKTVAFAAGVVMAVSVFWTIFGVRMNAAIDDVIKTSMEMRIHMTEDKIKSIEDVQRGVRSNQQ